VDNIVVRELIMEDIDQVCLMEEEAFSMPWHKESFIDMINNKDALYLVAADPTGNVYACAGLLGIVGEGDICNIVVRADSRQKGIGRMLVEALLKRGREEMKLTAFTLEVRESNMAARHLYEELGFVCEGVRPKFYELPDEDACIYWLRD